MRHLRFVFRRRVIRGSQGASTGISGSGVPLDERKGVTLRLLLLR